MHDMPAPVSVTRGTDAPRIAYRIREAAEQIGLSERQVWRLLAAGEIQSFKFGSSRRVTHQALLDYVDAKLAQAG
jgi:excisionase family DNA binding protein